MASFVDPRYIAFSLFCLCVLSTELIDEKPLFSFTFSFDQFEKDRSFGSQIALYDDAEIRNSTVSLCGRGRMVYKKPVRFFGTTPGFSTDFSFSISAGYDESLAFLLVPNNMSLISPNRDSPIFLAVKLGGYIAIYIGGEIFVKSRNISDVALALNSEQKLRAWIDYDGASKIIEVRIGKFNYSRPGKSLISCQIDLSNALWREAMYVGISSSSGTYAQKSNVYSWRFGVKLGAPYLMHSEPLDPESVSVQSYVEPPIHVRQSLPWRTVAALLIGAICGAFLASAVFVLRLNVVKRHPIAPVEYPVFCVESGHEKTVLDRSKVVGNAAK